ncbi:MAG: DUF2971 domain-containing protein [Deferribacterales bacterium]
MKEKLQDFSGYFEIIDNLRKFVTHIDPILNLSLIITPYNSNKVLYHYTSINTLNNILESRSLHLSNIHSMNDSTELFYGQNLILDTLENNKSKYFFAESLKDYFMKYNKEDVAIRLKNKKENSYTFFVLSLTINPDNLTLWRLYGDNCKGCSIGILSENIDDYSKHPKRDNQYNYSLSKKMYKVIYEKRKQSQIVVNYLNSILNFQQENMFSEDDLIQYYELISSSLNQIASVFKSKDYRDEREIRLIIETELAKNAIQYKNRNEQEIPFVEVVEKQKEDNLVVPNFISEIYTGPCFDENGVSSNHFIKDDITKGKPAIIKKSKISSFKP